MPSRFPVNFDQARRALISASVALAIGLGVASGLAADEPSVDFNRDIRPVFASKCFACHGPDENHREADLRLDVRQEAIDYGAISPEAPDDSELIRRIFAEDLDEVMPPPHANDSLSEEQKELFRRWVEQGAPYLEHWSFAPPKRPEVPSVDLAAWPRNPIDNFVLAKLEAKGMSPAPEADRYTLVRRLYLDLIGVPPTPDEADAFVSDANPMAYDKLVDQLMSSSRYGERWGRQWLDLARYADTNGYEKDRDRSIWPYRDWVIQAINADMPFDQFTIEQLAGDMIPNATDRQIIATGYHRNTMLNEEGGIDPLEYRFYAMVDRVATTGTVWLGLSTGCAQCHTHKYDPITHTDYYRLMALLNNADEPDQIVQQSDVLQRRAQLLTEIETLEAQLPGQFPPAEGDGASDLRREANFQLHFNQWLENERDRAQPWRTLVPSGLETNLPRLEVLRDGSIFSTGDITKRDVFKIRFTLTDAEVPLTALRLEVLPDERLPAGGPGRAYYEGRKGDFFLSEFAARINAVPVEFHTASHSYGQISIGSGNANAENVLDGDGSTGWSTAQREGQASHLVLNLKEPVRNAGELEIELLFERHFAASLGRFRFSAVHSDAPVAASALPSHIEELLTRDAHELGPGDLQTLRAYFVRTAPELAEARRPIDALRAQMPELPTTMVFQERPTDNPRPTFRHHRGEYLNAREEVQPGIPEFLDVKSNQHPSDRLEFARWLVSGENPLVGRVTANRAWQGLFGVGLHRTSDDFGTQAEPPTHPELLDWLASELVENEWSTKALHRLIVTSATYRQASEVTPERLRLDSQNELLARGARYRVPAEMVRDVMLRASGLLSTKMFGPGVRPPQPASVTAVAYGSPAWNVATDEDRYRRSIYTFAKRTAPFAAYAVFDAPSGETCLARRDRSNTPLQALTLLNDEMYLELAAGLARQAMLKSESAEGISTTMFRRLVTRPPRPEESNAIIEFYQRQIQRLAQGELKASEMLGDEAASNELAAWTMLARVLMNLDESITRP